MQELNLKEYEKSLPFVSEKVIQGYLFGSDADEFTMLDSSIGMPLIIDNPKHLPVFSKLQVRMKMFSNGEFWRFEAIEVREK